MTNVIPLAIGPLVMDSHPLLAMFWINAGQMSGVLTHCGFFIPGLPSPLAHDYHHQVFNACYGVTGTLDWLHKTTGNFEGWRQKWLKVE